MYRYSAKLIRVVDGDTFDAMVDLGFDIWVKKRVRLSGINAYESRTRNKQIKKKGLAAKARLEQVLKKEEEFSLVSNGVGKYGRCLADVYLVKRYVRSEKYYGKCINEMLVKEGHAVIYEC